MYKKDTYLMGIPEGPERKRAAMTFDILNDIHMTVSTQPEKCAKLMDTKIKVNNKTRRKMSIGIGGGSGFGAYGILELIRNFPKWWFSG